MAFRKVLFQRLFSMSRMANPALTKCRTSSPRTAVISASFDRQTTSNQPAHDPGDDGVFRRYIHRQSSAAGAATRFLPTGEKLLEKLREMDVSKDRIRLDGLRPPQILPEPPERNLTVADAKKILRLSQLEMVKSKLRLIERDFVNYSEFVEICRDVCSSADLGLEFVKVLDESGSVIVLGNVVFLRPEQEIETNVSHPDL